MICGLFSVLKNRLVLHRLFGSTIISKKTGHYLGSKTFLSRDLLEKGDIAISSGYLYLDNGNVEIEIGSQLYTVENVENYPEIEDIRQELLEERVIAETEQGLCFVEPYMIHSRQGNYTALSSSATIILHGSRNGWEAWVNDAGIPLKDIPEIKNKFS